MCHIRTEKQLDFHHLKQPQRIEQQNMIRRVEVVTILYILTTKDYLSIYLYTLHHRIHVWNPKPKTSETAQLVSHLRIARH